MGTAAIATWAACGRERPRVDPGDSSQGGGKNAGGSSQSGFVTDGAAICGADVHTPIGKPPLIYFVIDRSGSMAELDTDSGDTRYERVVDAAVQVVADLGSLVRTGAALFPDPEVVDSDECAVGAEVYAPKVSAGKTAFRDAIDGEPFGGTPVASTIEALSERILDQEGPRAVILATDGAPNCNAEATCEPSDCLVNLSGECPFDIENCCDPAQGGTWLNCVDRVSSVLAVQSLANAGAKVYVVGIPGSEQFSAILNQLAAVGGAAQPNADTFYYRVDDLDELSGVFKGIAGELVSCTYDLTDPPDAPGKTNVYFDGAVVVQDAENGWVWIDEDTIELVGDGCAKLKTGTVAEVQIVSGCPTETPR